jgi:hypothetical protein
MFSWLVHAYMCVCVCVCVCVHVSLRMVRTGGQVLAAPRHHLEGLNSHHRHGRFIYIYESIYVYNVCIYMYIYINF